MKLRGDSWFWLVALSLGVAVAQSAQHPASDWPTYGGDAGGMRYTSARQITPSNVSTLAPAWSFHTGSVAKKRPNTARSAFETTPILFRGALYLTSPFDEVFAVNPSTGVGLWQFDPKIMVKGEFGSLTSRGVAAWPAATSGAHTQDASAPCGGRIFLATVDARLIALDAATGAPCQDFGNAGTVDLSKNVDNYQKGDPYFFTSPPTVIGDLVIIGSAIGDNQRVDIDSGVVRAFDCRSGRLVWAWDPIPWAQRQKLHTGAANAWSVIAADPEHNLVFIPTGAPSPDFYGVTRAGDNRDANSVVALEATTGRRVWGFQVVHHDLWDYDVASEPLLFTFRGKTPAIAITTKMGLLFVLNRLTGEPLYPIAERPVPTSDIPGEQASPTQPFQDIASLAPTTLPADAHLGASPQDDADCRHAFSALRYDGIYTPPSTRGTLVFPGTLGGVNWGGASFDPSSGILYANTNRYAFRVTLVPRPSRLQEEHQDHLRQLGDVDWRLHPSRGAHRFAHHDGHPPVVPAQSHFSGHQCRDGADRARSSALLRANRAATTASFCRSFYPALRTRNQPPTWHSLYARPHAACDFQRNTLRHPTLGNSLRSQPEYRKVSLADATRHIDPRPAHRHRQPGWQYRYRFRPGLHRCFRATVAARFQRSHRRRVMGWCCAGPRAVHSHELHDQWPTIHRHCSRRPRSLRYANLRCISSIRFAQTLILRLL